MIAKQSKLQQQINKQQNINPLAQQTTPPPPAIIQQPMKQVNSNRKELSPKGTPQKNLHSASFGGNAQ